MRVFVAGGTGVVGRRLVPQLVARGHEVTATTTSAGKLGLLAELGAKGVVMDGLDAESVRNAVTGAQPDTVVHVMTAISPGHAGKPDFKHMDRWFAPTAAVAQAIRHLEDAVLGAGGAVLRYGGLYGPGATDDQVELVRKRQFPLVGSGSGYCSWVHVDDAPAPAGEWLPYLAEAAGAKRPMRVPAWLARLVAGKVAVEMMTEGRGFSNAKAKRELGW